MTNRAAATTAAPRAGARATIRDVAAAAGVSKSLVSLVFSEPARVSPERRQLVLDAAEELGFRPNWAARSLAVDRGNFVGILVADLHNPTFTDIVDSARSVLDTAGVFALLTGASVPGGPGRVLDRRLVDAIGDLRARSLMIVGSLPDMSPLERITRDIPIVVAGAVPEKLPIACRVRCDDDEGMRLVVEHLVGLGHRRIAYVAGDDSPISALRAAAFRSAVASLGVEVRSTIELCSGTQAGGHEAANKLLTGRWRPTAVAAVNDDVAIGVMTAASDRGLRVPEDLSVVGYDNLPWSGLPQVALTTVDPGNEDIGRKAAGWLLREIAGQPRQPEEFLAQPRLVRRATTSAAV